MSSRRIYSVISAPSALGLRQQGVTMLPAVLGNLGLLADQREVEWAGGLAPPDAPGFRDPTTGVRNQSAIRDFSRRLADRVGAVLDAQHFPLVLGGDCSILIGTALALRRRGRYGLAFIDGHADFYSPAAEPNGEVASMDLAIVTGREPAALADIDGLRPYILDRDVVLFAVRDADGAPREGSPDVRQTGIDVMDLGQVRRLGVTEAAQRARRKLEDDGTHGYWIHLDADVLNDDVMPAADYRTPDGLWPDELADALAALLASPMAVGMEVTIYNPQLDDALRSAGRTLARTINEAFAAAHRPQ